MSEREEVTVGSVWRDCDPRNEGRELRVERMTIVNDDPLFAYCSVREDSEQYWSEKQVRIACRRMKPRSNGYRRIS